MKNIIESNKGYSLTLAVGIVALLMIFSSSIAVITTHQLKNTKNYEESTQAYFNALSAIEKAKMLISENSQGFNYEDEITYEESGSAKVKIIGTPTLEEVSIDGFNVIPMPGSGNVGENCDINEAPKEDIELYDAIGNVVKTVGPLEHPCNWKKLEYGDSVSLPLFSYNQQTGEIINPNGLQNGGFEFDDFQIKIRTACKNYLLDNENSQVDNPVYLRDKWGNKICADNPDARYELDLEKGRFPNPGNNEDVYANEIDAEGDTIISWQINAENCSENYLTCQLLMNNKTFEEEGIRRYLREGNSEITEKDINVGSIYYEGLNINILEGVSLNFRHQGLSTFENYESKIIDDFLTLVEKPILNLSVVQPFFLKEDGLLNSRVAPYLEYQIVYKTSNGNSFMLPNNETIVIAEGFQGNFKQTLEVKQSKEASTLNFVIEN